MDIIVQHLQINKIITLGKGMFRFSKTKIVTTKHSDCFRIKPKTNQWDRMMYNPLFAYANNKPQLKL